MTTQHFDLTRLHTPGPRILLSVAFALGAALAACADDEGDELGEGTQPGQCDDGADNDGNGMFDCDDPGCAGAPVCEGAGDDDDDDDNDDDDDDDDNGGACVTEAEVIVSGTYEASASASSPADCSSIAGDNIICQVSQDQCDATVSCNVMGTDVELSGMLEYRGGDNAHGYDGSTTIMGFPVDYDVEFRCATDPTCEYLDYAVVSIIANGLTCVYQGNLV